MPKTKIKTKPTRTSGKARHPVVEPAVEVRDRNREEIEAKEGRGRSAPDRDKDRVRDDGPELTPLTKAEHKNVEALIEAKRQWKESRTSPPETGTIVRYKEEKVVDVVETREPTPEEIKAKENRGLIRTAV